MKCVLAVGLLALTLATACTKTGSETPESAMETANSTSSFGASDEAAVRALVASFAETWNRRDMEAMHALDTGDVEWVNVTGNHWRGVADVRRGHTNLFKVPVLSNSLRIESTILRVIAPDVVILVATMHFGASALPTGEMSPGDQKTIGSFTAVKRSGVWKLVHFQNTRVDPLAEGDGDPLNWDKTGVPAQLLKQ